MELIKFILPYYYTFKYNRVGLEGMAYFLEYTILPFIFYYIYDPEITLLEIFIIVTIVTTTYEIGYIYNNIISIRSEKSPTIRHTEDELEYGYDNISYIYFIRYSTAFILIGILYLFDDLYSAVMFVALFIISLVFYLYNILRAGWCNRFLFFILRFVRYYFTLFYIGTPAFLISLLISFVSLINNFSWYPARTKIAFPRFFGTKLFDGLIYTIFAIVFYALSYQYISYVFIYLALVKFILFGYKLLMISNK